MAENVIDIDLDLDELGVRAEDIETFEGKALEEWKEKCIQKVEQKAKDNQSAIRADIRKKTEEIDAIAAELKGATEKPHRQKLTNRIDKLTQEHRSLNLRLRAQITTDKKKLEKERSITLTERILFHQADVRLKDEVAEEAIQMRKERELKAIAIAEKRVREREIRLGDRNHRLGHTSQAAPGTRGEEVARLVRRPPPIEDPEEAAQREVLVQALRAVPNPQRRARAPQADPPAHHPPQRVEGEGEGDVTILDVDGEEGPAAHPRPAAKRGGQAGGAVARGRGRRGGAGGARGRGRGPAVPRSAAGERARKRRRISAEEESGLTDSEEEESGSDEEDSEDEEEDEEVVFDGGFKVPCKNWDALFDFQKICVTWLWELHRQGSGGVIADEMGLGKTIQAVVTLDALRYSGKLEGPIMLVCPVTILNQWEQELKKWAPAMRVETFHSKTKTCDTALGKARVLERAKMPKHWKKGYIVMASYSTFRLYSEAFMEVPWFYAVLDEGHSIKNPESEISQVCKRIKTKRRWMLTGSPIQNNLTELWSIFDFVVPGRLGTLSVFQSQFEVPIVRGGYQNATQFDVKAAYKCACVLRETIAPYILRRMKKDVDAQLPAKKEQVLFCSLTDDQLVDYSNYLQTDEVQKILRRTPGGSSGRRGEGTDCFRAISILRKICNHPDLIQYGDDADELAQTRRELVDRIIEEDRLLVSGKMKVVDQLLTMWHRQGHKVLLFSQTRIVLDILSRLVEQKEFKYIRMDGNTPSDARIPLVNKFNEDDSIFVALLTSKVGGVGINLTGANRVIIFDPDWNPTTDLQARERAWRVGQKRDVLVFRLMAMGTIEEKIYHRQIYKQFLTEKILLNPDQRQFFTVNNLKELFQLGDQYSAQLKRLYAQELGEAPKAIAAKLDRSTTWTEGEKTETQMIFKRQGIDARVDGSQGAPEEAGGEQQQAVRAKAKLERAKVEEVPVRLPSSQQPSPQGSVEIIDVDEEPEDGAPNRKPVKRELDQEVRELASLDHCVGVEEFVGEDEKEEGDGPGVVVTDDGGEVIKTTSGQFELKELLTNDSLQVVMDHDVIMKANHSSHQPSQREEYDSSVIAKRAREALMRSRDLAIRQSGSKPKPGAGPPAASGPSGEAPKTLPKGVPLGKSAQPGKTAVPARQESAGHLDRKALRRAFQQQMGKKTG